MSRALSTLLFLVVLSAPAQWAELPLDSMVDRLADRNGNIQFQAWAEVSSNTVYNEMLFKLAGGGFLDRDLRNRSRDALRGRNSVGADIGARMSWTGRTGFLGRDGLRPHIAVGTRQVLGVRFTKDVFDLVFFGNASFEDRTAVLGGSAHTSMNYQTLGAGVASRDQRSFVRLDVVNGRNLSASELSKADVFTAMDGRLLDAAVNGTYWNSDTARGPMAWQKGAGLSLNGRYAFRTDHNGLPVEVTVGVQDLGVVWWNNGSVRLERDTVIAFEGLQVDDIFDLDGVLSSGEQLLDTFGLRYQRGAFATVLPFRVELGMNITLQNGWYTGFLLQQLNLPGHALHFTAFGAKRFGERTMAGAELSTGGWGGIRLGGRVRHRVAERLWLGSGIAHLPGLVTSRTRGLGGQFSVLFDL